MKPYPFAPLTHFTVPFSFTTDSFQPCKRNSAHPEMRTAAGPCHRKQPKRKSGFQRIFIRGDRWMEKRLESGLDEDYFAADCTSTYPYFHCTTSRQTHVTHRIRNPGQQNHI